jgi:hypothetical protein
MAGTQIVLSIAELKLEPSPSAVNSYFITDIGKEGEFRYDASDTSTPDDALTIEAIGGVGRYKRILGDYISVSWFGARPNPIPPLDIPANTAAIQATVDTVINNTSLPRIVYFPPGEYTIDFPIICQKTVSNVFAQVQLTLQGGSGVDTKFLTLPVRISPTFKDKPAIIFQLAKGGGIVSIGIIGQYVNPNLTPYQFYNADWSTYGDPACLDLPTAVYCGVAIDPFPNNAAYAPSNKYPDLDDFYTRAGSDQGSGSSGLAFKQMYVSNFTACFANSVNGSTRNCECITWEDIMVENCKTGFVTTQPQEKGNVYNRIVAWNSVHTVISNVGYGWGLGGNIIMENLNVAGRVNRIFNVVAGGQSPWILRNVFTELLGTIGVLSATETQHSIAGGEINFYPTIHGEDLPPLAPECHGNLQGVVLSDLTLRRGLQDYSPLEFCGTNIVFNNCFLACQPVIPDFSGAGQQKIQFVNCRTIAGMIGLLGDISAAPASWKFYSVNGNFKLSDYAAEPWVEYGIRYEGEKQKMAKAFYFHGTVAKSANGTGMVTVSNGFPMSAFGGGQWLLYADNGGAGNLHILGRIKSIAGTTISLDCIKESLPDNTSWYIYLYKERLVVPPFKGTVTNGSNQITNCVFSWDTPEVGMFYDMKAYDYRDFPNANRIPMNGFVLLDITGTTITTSCTFRMDGSVEFYNGHGINELNILNDELSQSFFTGYAVNKYVIAGSVLRSSRETALGQDTWIATQSGRLDLSASPADRVILQFQRQTRTIGPYYYDPNFFVPLAAIMVDASGSSLAYKFPANTDHWYLLYLEYQTVTIYRTDNSANTITFSIAGGTINGASSYVMQNKMLRLYLDSTNDVKVLCDV